MNNETQNKVIIFQDDHGEINLDVSLTDETVWLSQKQMEELLIKAKRLFQSISITSLKKVN